MAAPIIDSVVAVPAVVQPGQAFVVTIMAHDPDARSGTLTGVVTDTQGNETLATAVLTIEDPLTYDLQDTDAVGFVITPRAGQPGVFDVIAP